MGPGGHIQWRLKGQPDDPRMRLTADMALLATPEFKHWVEVFARDITAFDKAFDEAWEQLTTNGGSWLATRRCVPFGPPPKYTVGPAQMLSTDGGAAGSRDVAPGGP